MATNFPTSLDSFTNPTPVSDTNTVSHAGQHQNHNDAITALETKVGITGSAVNTTLDYKTANITGGDRAIGATQTVSITNKTLSTATKILIGSDATGDTYYNGGSGTLTRLAIGATGQILTVVGGVPVWSSPTTSNTSYVVDTGAANAYVATLSPALAAYNPGVLVQFKAANANTTISTVNVNGLGVKTIKKLGGATDLVSGDIAAGMVVSLEYDGTNFVMLNPVANPPLTVVTDTGFLTSGAPGTTTTNATATVLTYALAGGTLSTNKGVRIRASVQVAVTASSNAATYTLNYGGSTLATFGYQGTGASVTIIQTIDVLLMGSGATGTQRANSILPVQIQSGSGGVVIGSGVAGSTSVSIDSTVSQNITIACTAGVSVTGTLLDYFIQKAI